MFINKEVFSKLDTIEDNAIMGKEELEKLGIKDLEIEELKKIGYITDIDYNLFKITYKEQRRRKNKSYNDLYFNVKNGMYLEAYESLREYSKYVASTEYLVYVKLYNEILLQLLEMKKITPIVLDDITDTKLIDKRLLNIYYKVINKKNGSALLSMFDYRDDILDNYPKVFKEFDILIKLMEELVVVRNNQDDYKDKMRAINYKKFKEAFYNTRYEDALKFLNEAIKNTCNISSITTFKHFRSILCAIINNKYVKKDIKYKDGKDQYKLFEALASNDFVEASNILNNMPISSNYHNFLRQMLDTLSNRVDNEVESNIELTNYDILELLYNEEYDELDKLLLRASNKGRLHSMTQKLLFFVKNSKRKLIKLNKYNNYRANTYNRFFEAITNNDFIEALNCVNYLIVEKDSIEWRIYKELLDVIVANTVSKSDFVDRLDEYEEELDEIYIEDAIYQVLKNLISTIRLVIDENLDSSYFDDKDYNDKNINDRFYYMLCDGYYITANKLAERINNKDFDVSKRVMCLIKELLNIFEISIKRNELNKNINNSSDITLKTSESYEDLLKNDEYSKLFDRLLKDENICDSDILAISAYLKSEEKTLSLKND